MAEGFAGCSTFFLALTLALARGFGSEIFLAAAVASGVRCSFFATAAAFFSGAVVTGGFAALFGGCLPCEGAAGVVLAIGCFFSVFPVSETEKAIFVPPAETSSSDEPTSFVPRYSLAS
ncbi:MAG: hypothetical protein D6806_18495 [Deltaproteobacteria bacterium]|nr:MAG: hypothetical protein D6806_18495 [Deltaproteobacteria bacterium]